MLIFELSNVRRVEDEKLVFLNLLITDVSDLLINVELLSVSTLQNQDIVIVSVKKEQKNTKAKMAYFIVKI